MIIINDDGIHKAVNEPAAPFQRADVQGTKLRNEEADLIMGKDRLLDFLPNNAKLKLLFCRFQFIQTAFGGIVYDAHLDRIEHILNALFCIRELFAK